MKKKVSNYYVNIKRKKMQIISMVSSVKESIVSTIKICANYLRAEKRTYQKRGTVGKFENPRANMVIHFTRCGPTTRYQRDQMERSAFSPFHRSLPFFHLPFIPLPRVQKQIHKEYIM